MLRLLVFKYKIDKTSFSEEFSFKVMLSTVKFLVSFLGTELKKLMSKSKESLTPRKISEVKELKSRFYKSRIELEAIFRV